MRKTKTQLFKPKSIMTAGFGSLVVIQIIAAFVYALERQDYSRANPLKTIDIKKISGQQNDGQLQNIQPDITIPQGTHVVGLYTCQAQVESISHLIPTVLKFNTYAFERGFGPSDQGIHTQSVVLGLQNDSPYLKSLGKLALLEGFQTGLNISVALDKKNKTQTTVGLSTFYLNPYNGVKDISQIKDDDSTFDLDVTLIAASEVEFYGKGIPKHFKVSARAKVMPEFDSYVNVALEVAGKYCSKKWTTPQEKQVLQLEAKNDFDTTALNLFRDQQKRIVRSQSQIMDISVECERNVSQ